MPSSRRERPGRVRVGTSGWVYPEWRGGFYPAGLPQRAELAHVASLLPTVEVNASFYRLQRPATYVRWAEATPDGFVFAVKGGRYLTHTLRLRGAGPALANYFASGPLALGRKLGPVLWQLPESLHLDQAPLQEFLELLPRTVGQATELAATSPRWSASDHEGLLAAPRTRVRHVLEVRHPSFDDAAARRLLERHDVAVVVADSGGRFPELDRPTTDLTYIRMHGPRELYRGGYGARTLDRWADRAEAWATRGDVFVYFNNDIGGHAPADAVALQRTLGRRHPRVFAAPPQG